MVAEGEGGERLGFIRLESATDHSTGERRGYVSEQVVPTLQYRAGVAHGILGAFRGASGMGAAPRASCPLLASIVAVGVPELKGVAYR